MTKPSEEGTRGEGNPLDRAHARIRELEAENERLRKELLRLKQSKLRGAAADHASSRLRDALRE